MNGSHYYIHTIDRLNFKFLANFAFVRDLTFLNYKYLMISREENTLYIMYAYCMWLNINVY